MGKDKGQVPPLLGNSLGGLQPITIFQPNLLGKVGG